MTMKEKIEVDSVVQEWINMPWEFLVILLIVGAFAIVVNGIEDHNRKESMSFREAIDLVGLPIVTFYQGDRKYNFLLDTGANLSVINQATLENIEHTLLEKTGNLYGVDGINREVSFATIDLVYKSNSYTEEFQVLDMQNTIDQVKAESGVNMVGIIGNEFFRKYKYVLDFDELVAYSKK